MLTPHAGTPTHLHEGQPDHYAPGSPPQQHLGGAEHHHQRGATTSMALAATLHCLTGCAIGEIGGLVIGTAAGLANAATIGLSVALAFVFGYTLSTLPLLRAGLPLGAAIGVVLAADTLSIATMEVVDNAVMALIPGAMDAGLVNVVFWISMAVALAAAFLVAFPVNHLLLARGKGHALTHRYHGATGRVTGARRFIPVLRTSTLVAVLVAFILGGLVVSVAAELERTSGGAQHAADQH